MAYPEGLLGPGERVRAHLRPHWRMLVVPAVLPPVVAGLAAWCAAILAGTSWPGPARIALAVLAVGLVGWFSLAPLLRWRCTHFVVTDRRLLVREGVLSRAGVDIAGSSVVAVRTRQRFAERLLGCGTLVVATRDARAEPWEFDGICRVAHTAALLEEVAEERGGLDGLDDGLDDGVDDGWGAWDDEDEQPEAPVRGGGRRRAGRLSRRRARAARTSR